LISLYLNTIRYLKIKQIYYRIWYFIYRPSINDYTTPLKRKKINKLDNIIKKKESTFDGKNFIFLNKSQSFSEINWNGRNTSVSKLWRYNQHYFDYLNEINSSQYLKFHTEILENWVRENKDFKGVGWEPYPTSLRIVNWVKWELSDNNLSKVCLQSLAVQARMLNKRIEWHILGNHLFSNAKALVFAGLFFFDEESKNWLNKGLRIINDQIDEQVLDDGGNFELTPMYHAIFLEDIFDLINISQVYKGAIQDNFVNKWKDISKKMLSWLETMTHADNEISFFNDAAIGIAANFKELNEYAERLNVKYRNNKFNKITHLINSGFIRYTLNEALLFLDVGQIGPKYLPGHAHADTLSFEMSLFGNRLLVNGGTSEYGTTSVRQYERSTKSHNTVTINDQNSSEVWKGFRVARRALPFNLKIEENESMIDIQCAHNGYKRLEGRPIHNRSWKLYKSSISIEDNIEGIYESSFAYFHFHPNVTLIKKQNYIWNINMPNNKKVTLEVIRGEPLQEKSYHSPEFGKRLQNECLKVALNKHKGSLVQISWSDK
tara:strand:- start:5398 stop:7038 length:1641 start_codon:yes stop_codon:yes gene_type:complete